MLFIVTVETISKKKKKILIPQKKKRDCVTLLIVP